jgi:hypothetical protein
MSETNKDIAVAFCKTPFYTFDAHGYPDYPFYDLCAAA